MPIDVDLGSDRPWQVGKAALSAQWILVVAILLSSLFLDLFGFWLSIAAIVAALGLVALVVGSKANLERKVPWALDAERGLMECALSYAEAIPDSLRGRWLPGFAEVATGTVRFQSDYVEAGSPSDGSLCSWTLSSCDRWTSLPRGPRAEARLAGCRTRNGQGSAARRDPATSACSCSQTGSENPSDGGVWP